MQTGAAGAFAPPLVLSRRRRRPKGRRREPRNMLRRRTQRRRITTPRPRVRALRRGRTGTIAMMTEVTSVDTAAVCRSTSTAGSAFPALPPAYVSITFNSQPYFHGDDGAYYQAQSDGQYLVVQPPVGAVVPSQPPGAVAIAVGPTTYYYFDGVFYVASDSSFAVVNPPPGIVVPARLPSDATQVVINGSVAFQFNGFNYTPSIQDGVTVYTVTPM